MKTTICSTEKCKQKANGMILICFLAFLLLLLLLIISSNEKFILREMQLQNTMIVRVYTENGEEPTCREIFAPDGYLGRSIIDNAFVPGTMTISKGGTRLFSGTMEIRIRGNTSASENSDDKNPYKIKLNEPEDLLFRNNSIYDDKEWLLIDCKDLKTITGLYLSELCGMEWEPQFEFVNLVINDDWKGSYLLIESVKQSEGRVHIKDSGFLVENDAYWWKPDTVFFKTIKSDYTAYTFKYPKSEKLSQKKVNEVQEKVNTIDRMILEGNEAVLGLIDMDSFASWLLIHDILGTSDGAGSNMYFYSDSADMGSLLKMGPTWDLAPCCENSDEWSEIHNSSPFIYDFTALLSFDAFYEVYRYTLNEVSFTLFDDVNEYLSGLLLKYRNDIQQSWDMNAERWNKEAASVEDEVFNMQSWLLNRIIWMNENIDDLHYPSLTLLLSDDELSAIVSLSDEEGKYNMIKIAVWGEEDGQNDVEWQEAEFLDGKWTAFIDLNEHHEYGMYSVHAYDYEDNEEGTKKVLIKNLVFNRFNRTIQ